MLFALLLLIVFLSFWAVFYATGPAIEHVLARVADRVAKFRYRDYLPVAAVLGAGLGATLVTGDLFEDLAEAVQANSPALQAIDRTVHEMASFARTDGSTRLFVAFTLLGTPVGMAIVVALVAAALALRGRWRWAVFLAFTGGVGGLINLALKTFFSRARPDLAEALRRAHGFSFPSGHAMGSTVVLGALGYLAFRACRGWRARAAALSLACTIALAISASRIYLGVHWISDVAAGIAAGLTWVITCIVAYETFRRIRRVRQTASSRTSRGE